MLRRTGFKRVPPSVRISDPDRVRAMPLPTAAFRVAVPVADIGIAISKSVPVRSEPYRRLVAGFPCIHCGIAGLSQCAHGNTGKGMGLKTDDRNSFPLCADSPGRPGCHARFDHHELFSRAARTEIEQAWAADTRRRIQAAGIWPATLPLWSES